MPTGYEPLQTLKPVAQDLWIVDGPAIRFWFMPFSTRMTVVRLADGTVWVHSPVALTERLADEIDAVGPVAHLIAPNWIHYAHVHSWQMRYPAAVTWAAPGVQARAAKFNSPARFDHDLGQDAPADWAGQIDQMIVEGSRIHHEAVFFHHASRTLILTDLIENFERQYLPWWMRLFVRRAKIADPDGQMPRDMRLTFWGREARLRAAVERMIGWAPERVILAHGRWYETDGAAELRRAFRWVLR